MDIETCQYVGFRLFLFSGSDSCWCLRNLWLQTRTRKEGDLSSIVNEKIYFSREASRKENRLPPPEREALAWCSVYMITYSIFTRTVLSNSFGACRFFAKCFDCGTSNASACICVLLESRHCRIVHMFFFSLKSGCTIAGCRNLYRPVKISTQRESRLMTAIFGIVVSETCNYRIQWRSERRWACRRTNRSKQIFFWSLVE